MKFVWLLEALVSTEMRTTEPVTAETMAAFAPEYARGVRFALGLQLPILVLAALMLDGGHLRNCIAIAIVVHWLGTLGIMYRRPSAPTTTDVAFIRYGVFVLTAAAVCIAPAVWRVIGESIHPGWERLRNG